MDKETNLTTKDYLDIARKYRKVLEEHGVRVLDMYLFGSRIKGTSHKWSDLDVGVVSDTFGQDLHGARVLLMNLRQGESDLIEPHPFLSADFANKFNPLVMEIKRTGVKVV